MVKVCKHTFFNTNYYYIASKIMKKIFLLLLGFLLHLGLQAQNPNCQTFIWPTDWSNGLTTLTAIDSSQYPVTSYQWSTGETTMSIQVAGPGNYCVTTTDEGGCTSSYCYSLPDQCWTTAWWYWIDDQHAYISSYSGPGYLDRTYLWSNGATTSDILVTSGGTYCVTVTNENGCTDSECVTIPEFPDNDSCYAEVETWFWPDSTVQLNALSDGQPATYQWSTGATTSSIIIDAPGNYCVTITYANGCQASDCYTYGDTSCNSYILLNWPNSSTADLVAWSNHPVSAYLWSTGETSSAIQVTEPGLYCVSTTNIYGCQSSTCLDIPDLGNFLNVYVHIPDSLNGVYAEVYLIEYDTAQGGTLTAIDTFFTTNGYGYATFEDVPPGEYLVKAALMPGTPHYDEFLPTYNIQHLFWDEADPLVFTPLTYGASISIHLIEGQNPGGPGFIGGLVSEGANFTASGDAARSEGDPMAGVQVILRRLDDTPVAATKTLADGTFSFDNIAWGTYRVSIDIPGITPLHQIVEISPDQPNAGEINFTVDGLNASSTSAAIEVGTLDVRPNPAHETLTVDNPGAQAGTLRVSSMQGQEVLRMAVSGSQAQVDVHSLPDGMYILTLYTGQKMYMSKISKQ